MGFEYNGIDGRELDVNEVVAKGTFRAPVKTVTAVIMWVVGIAVYVVPYILLTLKFINITFGNNNIFRLLETNLVYIVITPFYFGMIVALLHHGREYHYRADGRVFVVTSKGKPDEYFFYKDVLRVTYEEMRFLVFVKGCKVEIITRGDVTEYKYVFPGLIRHQPVRNMPFEAIRERIERK